MGNAGTTDCLLNPFRAKCFIWNKHVSALYIIPPHWHDPGRWNPSSCTLTLNVRGLSYLSLTLQGQYHGCWCPGTLRRQDISSHDIDYIDYGGPSLTWGRILSTCVISMWITDMKCEFVFPLNNLARKRLMVESQGHQQICTDYVYKTKCPITVSHEEGFQEPAALQSAFALIKYLHFCQYMKGKDCPNLIVLKKNLNYIINFLVRISWDYRLHRLHPRVYQVPWAGRWKCFFRET